MYKKAGIVIAILLIVAAIIVLSVSSCNKDGGIHVEQTTNSEVNTDVTDRDSDNDDYEDDQHKEFVRKDQSVDDNDISKLESVSTDEGSVSEVEDSSEDIVDSSVEDRSNEEVSSAVSKIEESSEVSQASEVSDNSVVEVEEKSNIESSVSESEVSKQEDEVSTDTSTGVLGYKELKEDELPEKISEKNLVGIITGKEILRQDNNIYMTILILDENQDVYRYYVPYSAYVGLEKGTKVEITVLVYIDSESGVSYKQVASVVVAE